MAIPRPKIRGEAAFWCKFFRKSAVVERMTPLDNNCKQVAAVNQRRSGNSSALRQSRPSLFGALFFKAGDRPVPGQRIVHATGKANTVIANDGSITPGNYVARNAAAALNRALKAKAEGAGGHSHDHAGHSH